MDLRNSTLVRGPSPRKIPVGAIGTHCLPSSQLKRAYFPIVCPCLLCGSRLYPCILGPQRSPCGTTQVYPFWMDNSFPWVHVQCPSPLGHQIWTWCCQWWHWARLMGPPLLLCLFSLPTFLPVLNSLRSLMPILHPSLEASSISHTSPK